MRGVTLKAWRAEHYVGLAELLRLLEPRVADFTWEPRLGEVAPGPGAERLEALGPEQRLTTFEARHLLTLDMQLIDGVLLGYAHSDQTSPTVVLRAVDSTSWDIESDDEEILALVRRAWPDASDIPV
ncbi:hypothetical protein D187_007375 [Cystobacter fuscus DSM 2262]|uniref:Uncharacterized protein n=1 Tax=Cystobacter fuscus (strain ATCC 25194 / DSM 2262 / NBRC 100088 / M29) TaxID=1242864 RepID=S9QHW0_CYSF2|nr:hypothetical protein [Cystobacter fuscus]EPX56033.1 hypothetical protein D187_007375 [Cystobacter fuscus DSM 2262]